MRTPLGLSLLLLTGCAATTPTLSIDVRTDLAPVGEFARVQTEVSTTPFTSAGVTGTVRTADAQPGAAYLEGVRVAALEGVVGDSWVRVSLLRADGTLLVQRTVALQTSGSYLLTIVLARSCAGVACPPLGGDAALTTCSGGTCVDPHCRGAAMSASCGRPQCREAIDCGAHGACGASVCAEGVCLTAPSDALCVGGVCTNDFRCVLASDAGPGDAGLPTDAGPGGCPGGCDDHDGCTDDACNAGRCTHTPHVGGCDDGDPCTHDDVCTGTHCGGTSYSCAGMAPPCMSATCDGSGGCSIGGGCGPGSTCSGGSCVACGGADQTCCDAGGCNSGLWCYGGVCTCAQPGGPCCPWDSSCAGGATCMGGTCCMGAGMPCGPCCAGLSCLSGFCF